MSKIEVIEVSKEKANEIIGSLSPEGLFYTIDDGVYVGIDNTSSEAYVEEFKTLEKCEKWLRNEEDEEDLVSGQERILVQESDKVDHSNNSEEGKHKRLIDYIGDRHGVNYANVMDYLKDLQYNTPERNVEELVNTLLYIEANER